MDAITEPFQNQRGRLTVIGYNVETHEGSAKKKYQRPGESEKRRTNHGRNAVGRWTTGPDATLSTTRQLEKIYDELREEKAKILAEKAELLKEPAKLAKERDDYLQQPSYRLSQATIDGLKAKIAKYDYSILGHQISVSAYEIVDRCEVCHAGIREPVDLKAADLAS